MATNRTTVRATIGLLLAAVLSVVVVGAAGAHGPVGEMTVLAAEPVGATQIRLQVGIIYENDEELAEDAIVVAELTGPDGATVGPVDLPRTTGAMYEAVIDVPTSGTWTAEISSTEPSSEQTATIAVGGAAAPSGDPDTTSTTAAPLTTTTTSPSTTTVSSSTGSSSSTPVALIAVLAAVVVAAIIGGVLWQRNRKT